MREDYEVPQSTAHFVYIDPHIHAVIISAEWNVRYNKIVWQVDVLMKRKKKLPVIASTT